MKRLSYILFTLLLFTFACKEPDINDPDTGKELNERISYEVLGQTENGFQVNDISETVIRSRGELSSFVSLSNTSVNTSLLNKMSATDFEKELLVVISASNISESSRITIDSVYLDENADIRFNYRIYQKNGNAAKVNNPTLVVLIKNHKDAVIKFSHKIEIDGENPQFDGFRTIATDIKVSSHKKWKEVLANLSDAYKWSLQYGYSGNSLLDSVDFDKEMVITVGTGALSNMEGEYRISDIKQQGNRLYVYSTFNVGKVRMNRENAHNHFVKIKKTHLPIIFVPTKLVHNNTDEGIYYEPYVIAQKVVTADTKASVIKATNLAEMFSVINQTPNFNVGNVDIDFEFFDLLIVKSPTTSSKIYNFEVKDLERSGGEIEGKVIFNQVMVGANQKMDSYALIRILKSNLSISSDFEVELK